MEFKILSNEKSVYHITTSYFADECELFVGFRAFTKGIERIDEKKDLYVPEINFAEKPDGEIHKSKMHTCPRHPERSKAQSMDLGYEQMLNGAESMMDSAPFVLFELFNLSCFGIETFVASITHGEGFSGKCAI